MYSIRKATPEDAQVVCRITRESIIKVCVKDHKQDMVAQEEWLRNKTPENFKTWIETKDNLSFVVLNDADKPVGFI